MIRSEAMQQALADRLLAMADDELVLGHRNSEWTGHAPILEEDIAFANIAQDELGHAGIWLNLRCRLTGENSDQLVFFRELDQYRNVQMVELPKGDWAFTMLRQFLFDLYEDIQLERLTGSTHLPLAEAAAKIRPEELYHLRHTLAWVRRLGLGTQESNRRMQRALDALLPLARQLFDPLSGDALLISAGVIPDPVDVQEEWRRMLLPLLVEIGLRVPVAPEPALSREDHTRHLTELLADMQQVARADPHAEW